LSYLCLSAQGDNCEGAMKQAGCVCEVDKQGVVGLPDHADGRDIPADGGYQVGFFGQGRALCYIPIYDFTTLRLAACGRFPSANRG